MLLLHILAATLAMGAAAILAALACRLARRIGLVDRPNARSAHVMATPLGGGVAIMVVVTIALAVFASQGMISFADFAVLAGGGVSVAVLGLVDDWRPLSTHFRLAAHGIAATWAIWWLGGVPDLQVGEYMVSFGWTGYPLGVLGIVWSLNLFNFMDGLDGIATSEAAFMGIAAAVVLVTITGADGTSLAALTLGMACAGFLVLNWPPAKIFLGDAGSGYLGYSLACLALITARDNPVSIWMFAILGALFVVDATVTFVRRIARHERYDVGHRTHGYQRLSRRWGSHRPVSLLVIVIDVVVLLPAAFVAVRRPGWAATIALFVLLTVTVAALLVGSGKKEQERNLPPQKHPEVL